MERSNRSNVYRALVVRVEGEQVEHDPIDRDLQLVHLSVLLPAGPPPV